MTGFDDDFGQTNISFGRAPDLPADADDKGHYLVVIEGQDTGRIVEIREHPMTIGRDASQDLVFADTEMSRRHAMVSIVRRLCIVEDLKSTNGTFQDGERIAAPMVVPEGRTIRVGRQVLRYERRHRRDVERSLELERDLQKANSYVLALLPPPIDDGPLQVAWRFLPSAQLGGDAFGYDWLDDDTFVFYLMDVSGHGVGAAMHSVTVMNVLRQRALPQVDFADPAAVLASLNDRFQMDQHDGMYFTIWYGVYRLSARMLRCSAAGHHAAYLVPADRTAAAPLAIPDLMIGAMPDMTYEVREAPVAPGSTLYLFSDGCFEIVTKDGDQWTLRDFVPRLLDPAVPRTSEPDRLYALIRDRARPGLLDDDFSLMTVLFT